MDLNSRMESFEQDSRVLEEIAKQYPTDSKEYHALRRAALALWYALNERFVEFEEYVREFNQHLSSSAKQDVKEIGIDPDSDPNAQ